MGMGRAAHMRTHVRSGDAKEIDNRHIEEHGGIHWEPTEKWKAGKTWSGKEWVKK